MNYECLITGLPEAGEMKMEDLEQLLDESLTDKDKKQLRLLKLRSRHGACEFIKDWLDFTKMVNNVLTAEVCKKHGLDVSKFIVGSMPDEVPAEMEMVKREVDLAKREQAIDGVYTAFLERRTEGIYFSLENVLAYYLQTQIINRWKPLTTDNGEQVFREMVADMKKGVSF